MEGSRPKTLGTGDSARCPSCNALLTADAEWCGQCFASLKPASVPREELAAKVGIKVSEEPTTSSDVDQGDGGAGPVASKPRLSWPCPACEHENDIELNRCERCGTPFAALMRADEAPVKIEPKEALTWSLIYPGLGHHKAGRTADGVARGTAFTLSFILLLMVALSGQGSAGQAIMVSIYLVTTITVYLGSAAEAYRIASGGAPFISSRMLLWVTVGLLLASIVLLAITATAFARR